MTYSKRELEILDKLLGGYKIEKLETVEAHLSEGIGLFMPKVKSQIEMTTLKHKHDSYQFIVSFDDKVSFQVDSREVINRPGLITGFSPGLVHCEKYRDSNPHYIVIFIDALYFEGQLAKYEDSKHFKLAGDSVKLPVDLLSYLKSFMIESDNNLQGSEVFLSSIGTLICNAIIRGYLNVQLNTKRVATRFDINSTIEYMHSNFTNKLTLNDLAGYAKMSKTHFSRVFKEETGQTVMEYLNDVRMENVKRQLTYSTKSITEIALECGYQSSSYLSTSFQTKFGMSPSAYKTKIKIK